MEKCRRRNIFNEMNFETLRTNRANFHFEPNDNTRNERWLQWWWQQSRVKLKSYTFACDYSFYCRILLTYIYIYIFQYAHKRLQTHTHTQSMHTHEIGSTTLSLRYFIWCFKIFHMKYHAQWALLMWNTSTKMCGFDDGYENGDAVSVTAEAERGGEVISENRKCYRNMNFDKVYKRNKITTKAKSKV